MNDQFFQSIKTGMAAIIAVMIMCTLPAASFAQVIIAENFDSVSVPWHCNSATLDPPNSNWTSVSACQSATYNSVTHYSMEITSGSGRSGNGLQIYRKNDFPPLRDTYSMLNFDGFSGSQRDITIGWYMKIPVGIAVSSMDYIKIWRGNMTGNEFYLNFNAGGGSWATSAKMQFLANSSTWYTLLTHSELIALQDNQWHYYQVRMSLSSTGQSNGILAFWVDGVQHNICDWEGANCQSSKTNVNYGTSTSSVFTHFAYGIGNRDDAATYQTSWQAFYFDDLIIATTKAETDQNTGSSSPTVLIATSNPSSTSTGSLAISGTASDDVGVSSCKYRLGSAPDSSSGTALNGTASWSGTASGFSSGSNTLYVGCTDTAGNWGSRSITVNFAPSDATPPATSISTSNPSSITSDSLTITGTASDSVGVSGCKWRIGSAPNASNGTACTGTNSFSCSTSGYSSGSNTAYVGCYDAAGNYGNSSITVNYSPSTSANLLLSEDFEDTNFTSRGWYDYTSTSGSITASQYQSGTHAFVCSFLSGGQGCNAGNPGRHLFTASDELYVDFYIKFATGWRGSQRTYHPHMFYLLSDADGDWDGPANNYLSTYIEFLSDVGSPYTIRPLLALQDEKNVNTSYGTPPNNLSSTTENRSVNYCNTPVSAGAAGTCYADYTYYSANTWAASSASLSTNAWHHVQAYFKMNTIIGGKGQNNGIMQMWIDGSQVINHSDVLYRTNQHPTLKWHQIILGPYIGDGSPVAQSFYIDNLKIYDGNPSGSSVNPVGGVSVISITNP